MSKMFPETETDNPMTGCNHGCPWCWARPLALKYQLQGQVKYRDGFTPSMHWRNLDKPPKHVKKNKDGERGNLFITSMGDLFCNWSEDRWIIAIMQWCQASKHDQNFLFLTKNPRRYIEIITKRPDLLDPCFVFGTTLETTEDEQCKRHLAPNAPPPTARFQALHDFRLAFPDTRRFLSIEPVMNFDVRLMYAWVTNIKPEFAFIGYDNYNYIPRDFEPDMAKVRVLIKLTEKLTRWTTKTMREG